MFCPLLDQSIFAAVNEKIIDKYRSLKTAFDNLSKHEKAIKREVLVACLTDLPLERKLRNDEVQDMIDLADADGSGTIEFQEFQIIFGTGMLRAFWRASAIMRKQRGVFDFGFCMKRRRCTRLHWFLFAYSCTHANARRQTT